MPVGVIATVGAAVIGAGATMLASDKASHAQTSAANTAAETERLNAEKNNKLATDMYGWNAARLDPYNAMGQAAGDQYMGILLGDAAGHTGSGWAPSGPVPAATPTPATTPAPSATPAPASSFPSGGTPLSQLAGLAQQNALAPAVAPAAPASSALAPIVAQQAQAAIAAGADPAAVAARAASMGVHL